MVALQQMLDLMDGEVTSATGDRGNDVAVQVAAGSETNAGERDGSGALCSEVESAGNDAVRAGGL